MEQSAERRRTRVCGKIDRLPPEIKLQVDELLANSSNSFTAISEWLGEQGFEISRGAVGRYSRRMNKAAARLAESLEKTKLILDRIERNPDADMGKAAQMVLMDSLMQKVSTADDEVFEMPLEKAGKLLAELRRVEVAERKLAFDMRQKIDLAFDQLEHQLMDTIKHDPTLSAQLRDILTKARGMIANE